MSYCHVLDPDGPHGPFHGDHCGRCPEPPEARMAAETQRRKSAERALAICERRLALAEVALRGCEPFLGARYVVEEYFEASRIPGAARAESEAPPAGRFVDGGMFTFNWPKVQRGDDGTGGWSRRLVEFAEAITAEVVALRAVESPVTGDAPKGTTDSPTDAFQMLHAHIERHAMRSVTPGQYVGAHEALGVLRNLELAYRQACTNLATIRPSGLDASLGEDAQRYYDALLAGWGGIEGWDDREATEFVTVYAWLIERGQPERQDPTVWVDEIREHDGWVEWTAEANKAQRFGTKDEAEVLIKQFLMSPREPGATARAVEHGFMEAERGA